MLQLYTVKYSTTTFAIMGACNRVARRAGWSDERIKTVMDEMRAGDYDHLLQTAMRHFDIE